MARVLAHETKIAMFRAAVAADFAGETYMSPSRVAAALIRTNAVEVFCGYERIGTPALINAADEPGEQPLADCERAAKLALAAQGTTFGSPEHRRGIRPRPMAESLRREFDALLHCRRRAPVGPVELLSAVLRADAALARRLASAGLTAAAIEARVE